VNKKELLDRLPAISQPNLYILRTDASNFEEIMLSLKTIIIGQVKADRTDHIFDFPVASQERFQPYYFGKAILAWKTPLRCVLVMSHRVSTGELFTSRCTAAHELQEVMYRSSRFFQSSRS
jgi:hypothetical protein